MSSIKKADNYTKHELFYPLLVAWLSIRQENRNLENWFVKRGYKHIAIYGMKELGECLYEELRISSVKVDYVIDKKTERIYTEVEVYKPENILPEVDIIVVTAISFFEEIKADLKDKIKCDIVSLEDVVYSEA